MVSVTDPDSRHIKSNEAYVQGYNAQAVVDQNQIVLAAEITNSTVDFSQLDPMMTAALGELYEAHELNRPRCAVLMTELVAKHKPGGSWAGAWSVAVTLVRHTRCSHFYLAL